MTQDAMAIFDGDSEQMARDRIQQLRLEIESARLDHIVRIRNLRARYDKDVDYSYEWMMAEVSPRQRGIDVITKNLVFMMERTVKPMIIKDDADILLPVTEDRG